MANTFRVLTGPTASGKTSWLIQLGHQKPLLAIPADSRQVYRHMNIGTGKPPPADTEIVPHYGLDLLEPGSPFSAYQFLTLALEGLAFACKAGREPWVCGGTGLYIRALVEKLPLGARPRPGLRSALGKRLEQVTSAEIAQALDLKVKDPHNPARVIRAAEKACREETRASAIYQWAGLTPGDATRDGQDDDVGPVLSSLRGWECAGIAVLDPGKAALDQRIIDRVGYMYENGLVEEVQNLRKLGYGTALTVKTAIGYKEAGLLLDGKFSKQEALQRTIIRTRQYARRQRIYFRGRGWPVFNEEQLSARDGTI